MKAIQEKKTIEEIFKELWLKYGDYNKCIEELRKVGINASLKYLIVLRYRLNLPKMREVFLSRKCFYCGKNAEMIFGFQKSKNPIPVCKKCYNRENSKIFRKKHPDYYKIRYKRYYKKHRIEILRKHSAYVKSRRFYICPMICPICGAKGYLIAFFMERLTTKHKTKPYFYILHHIYHGKKKPTSFTCYIGKDEELYDKYFHLLPLCNCKKCRLKRGEINGSNTERENNRRDI